MVETQSHQCGDLHAIDSKYGQRYCKYGRLHRDNDLPAYVGRFIQIWYQ